MSELFKKELKEAGLERYTHYLLPPLLARFHLPAQTLETAALFEALELGGLEGYTGFPTALKAINPSTGDRQRVEEFLERFFTTHTNLPLATRETLEAIKRSIVIPVSIPPLNVFHTIDFKLRPDVHTSLDAPYRPLLLTVGQPVPADLTIKHSRHWDVNPTGEEMEFFYEIHVPKPDIWLVSGRRKGHFTGLPQGNTVQIGVLLVPCRAGELALPEVTVKCVGVGKGVEEERRRRAHEVVGETEMRGGQVRVVMDVRSTTVRIGEGLGGGQGLEVR